MKRIKVKKIKKDVVSIRNNTDELIKVTFINRYDQRGEFSVSPHGEYQLHFTKRVHLFIPDGNSTIERYFTNNSKTANEIAGEAALETIDLALDIGGEILDVAADSAGGIFETILELLGDILEFIGDIFD